MLSYFTDPILRAPTIGSMLIGVTSGLVGVVVFLRRQSLVGEALSHASFPGVILGVIAAGLLGVGSVSGGGALALMIMAGAFVSSLFGAWAIGFMVRRLSVRSDTALCFILSAFFGIGLTLASQVQYSFSDLYQQIQVYFYGQTATMTDFHLVIYALLSSLVLLTLVIFYKEIQLVIFDSHYAKSLGVKTKPVDLLLLFLTVSAVVVGIRSVGVVLMSAMLIAPAAAARQFTHTLSRMFLLAALFGAASGFLGVYFSSELSRIFSENFPGERVSLPTGPMIVLVAAFLCIASLLFAPQNGLFLRYIRIVHFRYRCACENLLKALWRSREKSLSFEEIIEEQNNSAVYLRLILMRLVRQRWVKKIEGGIYSLTREGDAWASRIVRLHRLWEVYLVDYLGVGAEKVHRSAEEMEHIITPQLEEELTDLLDDPKRDPHHQPIPPKHQEP